MCIDKNLNNNILFIVCLTGSEIRESYLFIGDHHIETASSKFFRRHKTPLEGAATREWSDFAVAVEMGDNLIVGKRRSCRDGKMRGCGTIGFLYSPSIWVREDPANCFFFIHIKIQNASQNESYKYINVLFTYPESQEGQLSSVGARHLSQNTGTRFIEMWICFRVIICVFSFRRSTRISMENVRSLWLYGLSDIDWHPTQANKFRHVK